MVEMYMLKSNYCQIKEHTFVNAIKQYELEDVYLYANYNLNCEFDRQEFEQMLEAESDDYKFDKMDEDYLRFKLSKNKKQKAKLAEMFLKEYDKSKNYDL